jgi:ubiquinone/menaquinone biosynthesis C-methylase UbiE
MVTSVAADFTARYNPVETFVYDRVIADAVQRFALDVLDDFLPRLQQEAKVLEVGCGGGQLAAEILRRRDDLAFTGLDLAGDELKRARQRAPGGTFVQGSALELPFDDDDFDAVFSIASIKHWPDQRQGVSECVRVLRPAGALVIAEVDRACTLEAAHNFISHWHIPRLARPLALPLFRTYVAGRSLDRDEARAHLKSQPLKDAEVRVQPELPSLLMLGEKKES